MTRFQVVCWYERHFQSGFKPGIYRIWRMRECVW